MGATGHPLHDGVAVKKRWWVLAPLGAVVVLCAGLLGGFWSAMAPSPPTAGARPASPSPAGQVTAPPPPPAARARGTCGLSVRVVTPEGEPLDGVDVGFATIEEQAEQYDSGAPDRFADGAWAEDAPPHPAEWLTDADGVGTLDELPCAPGTVWAGFGARSLIRARQLAVPGAGPRPPVVELVLDPAGLVRVVVTDALGTPLAGASLFAFHAGADRPAEVTIQPDASVLGAFLVEQRVGQPLDLDVTYSQRGPMHAAFEEQSVPLDLQLEDLDRADADGVVEEIEVALDVRRAVLVRCRGLPGDSCEGVMPIQCTHPMSPLGAVCRGEDVLSCVCPEGPAAVRGGGATVRVAPGDREAWLDFTAGGSIAGRVVRDGTPSTCRAHLFRLPEYLEDLPRGGVLAREGRCDRDGAFRFDGLVPGDWNVAVERGNLERTLPPVRVRSGLVDVGEVELWGGGSIEGQVLDGLTDQPVRYAEVLAIRVADPGGRSTPFPGTADANGEFELVGLPPGDWDVAAIRSPFRSTRVRVEEGLATEGVEVRTAEASVLEDNGIDLRTEPGEGLVVETVDPDGAAADNGLEEGDVVVGVSVLGFDSTALPPELSEQLAAGLLGHWGGPGVDLVIEREGVLMEVELE